MPSWVTLKALGFLSGALGLALLAASAFGWLQTERLGAANATIDAKDLVIETQQTRIENDALAIAQRDALITEQNTAVLALAEASKANRAAYEARIAQADRRAAGYQAEAADIMSRHIETTDELERSRAALSLIHEYVGKED